MGWEVVGVNKEGSALMGEYRDSVYWRLRYLGEVGRDICSGRRDMWERGDILWKRMLHGKMKGKVYHVRERDEK
ncbi:hypothetical protein SLA2020_428120 [Shorea laevis]